VQSGFIVTGTDYEFCCTAGIYPTRLWLYFYIYWFRLNGNGINQPKKTAKKIPSEATEGFFVQLKKKLLLWSQELPLQHSPL